MLNIIKSDLFRIVRGKAIYIAIAIIIFLSTMSCFELSAGYIGMAKTDDDELTEKEIQVLQELEEAKGIREYRKIIKENFEFEIDKSVIGNNMNLYYFFIIITVVVVTTDFSNKSIKNTLSSAISRKKYYFSKLALMIILGTFLILINNYGTHLIDLIMNGEKFTSSIMDITKLTLMQLPVLYGIISLLVCFAFLFRKTSAFNTIAIPFITIFQLICMGAINLLKINGDIFYKYEAQNMLRNLAGNPSAEYIIQCTGIALVCIIIFNIIGYSSFKKAEIK